MPVPKKQFGKKGFLASALRVNMGNLAPYALPGPTHGLAAWQGPKNPGK